MESNNQRIEPPKNFRELDIILNNQIIRIAGMGNPIRYNKFRPLESVMDFLFNKNIDVFISFSDTAEKSAEDTPNKTAFQKHEDIIEGIIKSKGKIYYSLPLVDLQPISLDTFNKVNEIINKHAPKRVVMYCGAGLGRTGTILVSLILRSLIEEKVKKESDLDLNHFLLKEKEFNHVIPLANNVTAKCSDLVYQAIQIARNPKSQSPVLSVEGIGDIQSLHELEAHLIQQLDHFPSFKFKQLITKIRKEIDRFETDSKSIFSVAMMKKAEQIDAALKRAIESGINFPSEKEFLEYKNSADKLSIKEALNIPRILNTPETKSFKNITNNNT